MGLTFEIVGLKRVWAVKRKESSYFSKLLLVYSWVTAKQKTTKNSTIKCSQHIMNSINACWLKFILYSNSDLFPENLGAWSDEQGEKFYHNIYIYVGIETSRQVEPFNDVGFIAFVNCLYSLHLGRKFLRLIELNKL